MILEIAILKVIEGQEAEFERAFDEAKGIVSAVPGFVGLELRKCLERPNEYALLIRWESLKDHTEGFRKSAAYERWKKLLHHFYDPFPTVAHYVRVAEA